MQFVALNVEFKQINAFAGFEIIVECHHSNLKSATRIPFSHIRPMIDIQIVGDVKHGLSTTLSNHCRPEVYIWQLSRGTTQSHEIIRARFERMDDTVWSDATRQELRINPDIRARIHHDRAGK